MHCDCTVVYMCTNTVNIKYVILASKNDTTYMYIILFHILLCLGVYHGG